MFFGTGPAGKSHANGYLLRRVTAIFVILAFTLFDAGRYAPQSYASPVAVVADPAAAFFAVPKELGTVDEVYNVPHLPGLEMTGEVNESRIPSPKSQKLVVFIQDAHDSLEAQENIAKLVGHLVKEKGIKTVFEEGYEGAVPTDQFFGFIKDPALKQKVSYFLLDKLRVGGAEYAHINRTRDFDLIGVENLKLYRENIRHYQTAALNREATEEDLSNLIARVASLADQYLPKDLKLLLKRQERFYAGKLSLLDYLKDLQALGTKNKGSQAASQFSQTYPALSILLIAQTSKDRKVIKQLNALDFTAIFRDIAAWESDISKVFLQNERDRQLFGYLQGLNLLRRLNRIELTPAEYDAVKETARDFKTQTLVEFIASETHKPVVLSKGWEQHIKDPILFYEAARSRDGAVRSRLHDFAKDPGEQTATLVFGGFHANRIKEILREEGLSYIVVSPRITTIDKKHQGYYKQLMSVGHYPFETPFLVTRANKPPSDYVLATQMGDHAVDQVLRSIVSIVRGPGSGSDAGSLNGIIERQLTRDAGNSEAAVLTLKARAEMREEPFRNIKDLIKGSLPKAKPGIFNVPNYPLEVHREGPILEDHLQSMLDVLNDPFASAEIPFRFQKILADPQWRSFFEQFIVDHDLAKTVITPQEMTEGNNRFMLYPKHEEVGAQMLVSDPTLAAGLSSRKTFVEVVRLHGALYFVPGAAQGVPDRATFQEFVDQIASDVDAHEMLELLIAADFLDAIATKRADPFQVRVRNMAEAFEVWEVNQRMAAVYEKVFKSAKAMDDFDVAYLTANPDHFKNGEPLVGEASALLMLFSEQDRSEPLFENIRNFKRDLVDSLQLKNDEILWNPELQLHSSIFSPNKRFIPKLPEASMNEGVIQNLSKAISLARSYKVQWQGVTLGANGTLVLQGFVTSQDILKMRESLAKDFPAAEFPDVFTHNVVHATLGRFKKSIGKERYKKLLQKINEIREQPVDGVTSLRGKPFGETIVKQLSYIRATLKEGQQIGEDSFEALSVHRLQSSDRAEQRVPFQLSEMAAAAKVPGENWRVDVATLPEGMLKQFMDFLNEKGTDDVIPLGGVIRDTLLGSTPKDIDFCVRVDLPQALRESFERDVLLLTPRTLNQKYQLSYRADMVLNRVAKRLGVSTARLFQLRESFRGTSLEYAFSSFVVGDHLIDASWAEGFSIEQIGMDRQGHIYQPLHKQSLTDLSEGNIMIRQPVGSGLRSGISLKTVLKGVRYKHQLGFTLEKKTESLLTSKLRLTVKKAEVLPLLKRVGQAVRILLSALWNAAKNVSLAPAYLGEAWRRMGPLFRDRSFIFDVARQWFEKALESVSDRDSLLRDLESFGVLENLRLSGVAVDEVIARFNAPQPAVPDVPLQTAEAEAGRSEMRGELESKTPSAGAKTPEYPTVMEVYEPGTEIALLTNPEPSGRLSFDMIERKYWWDGKVLKDFGFGAPSPEGLPAINLLWDEWDRKIPEAMRKGKVHVYSFHNLFYSDWFVAFDGETKHLLYRAGEPFERRTYSMFVVWKDKGRKPSSEDLVFRTIPGGAPGKVSVFQESDTEKRNDLSGEIQFAVFGQRIIHEGSDVPLEMSAHQFQDIFQLYRFPQFIRQEGVKSTYGLSLGAEEIAVWQQKDLKKFRSVVRGGGLIEIDLNRYFKRATFNGETVLFANDAESLSRMKKTAFAALGYKEVEWPGNPASLDEGEYAVQGTRLVMKLKPFPYPHNLIGVTKSGHVVAIVFTGDKMKGLGVPAQKLAEKCRAVYAEKYPHAANDPLVSVHLLANSRDGIQRTVDEGVGTITAASIDYYSRVTAALAIAVKPSPSPASHGAVRSEMRDEKKWRGLMEKVRTGTFGDERWVDAATQLVDKFFNGETEKALLEQLPVVEKDFYKKYKVWIFHRPGDPQLGFKAEDLKMIGRVFAAVPPSQLRKEVVRIIQKVPATDPSETSEFLKRVKALEAPENPQENGALTSPEEKAFLEWLVKRPGFVVPQRDGTYEKEGRIIRIAKIVDPRQFQRLLTHEVGHGAYHFYLPLEQQSRFRELFTASRKALGAARQLSSRDGERALAENFTSSYGATEFGEDFAESYMEVYAGAIKKTVMSDLSRGKMKIAASRKWWEIPAVLKVRRFVLDRPVSALDLGLGLIAGSLIAGIMISERVVLNNERIMPAALRQGAIDGLERIAFEMSEAKDPDAQVVLHKKFVEAWEKSGLSQATARSVSNFKFIDNYEQRKTEQIIPKVGAAIFGVFSFVMLGIIVYFKWFKTWNESRNKRFSRSLRSEVRSPQGGRSISQATVHRSEMREDAEVRAFDASVQAEFENITTKVPSADVVVLVPFYNEMPEAGLPGTRGQVIDVRKLVKTLGASLQDILKKRGLKRALVLCIGETKGAQAQKALKLLSDSIPQGVDLKQVDPKVPSSREAKVLFEVYGKEERFAGLIGKKWATRLGMKVARELGADLVSLDGDMKVGPDWLSRFVEPVLAKKANYVSPHYIRYYGKDDIPIIDQLVNPLFAALFGTSVRMPNAGEYVASRDLVEDYLNDDEIWLAGIPFEEQFAARAVVWGKKVMDVWAEEKVHKEAPVENNLDAYLKIALDVFSQQIADHPDWWQGRSFKGKGGTALPLVFRAVQAIQAFLNRFVGFLFDRTGWNWLKKIRFDLIHCYSGPGGIDRSSWIKTFKAEYAVLKDKGWYSKHWPEIIPVLERLENFSDAEFNFSSKEWAEAVMRFLPRYEKATREDKPEYIKAFKPIFRARVASFVGDVEGLTLHDAEARLAEQAKDFAAAKSTVFVLEPLKKMLLTDVPGLLNAEWLDRSIPRWSVLKKMPQWGPHKNTVAEHIVGSIEELFKEPLFRGIGPSRQETVLMAQFFHDFGKNLKFRVLPDDHNLEGQKIVKPILRNLGLKEEEVEKYAWYVKHHDVMFRLAYKGGLRENIQDETLAQFINKLTVQEVDLFTLLFLADMGESSVGNAEPENRAKILEVASKLREVVAKVKVLESEKARLAEIKGFQRYLKESHVDYKRGDSGKAQETKVSDMQGLYDLIESGDLMGSLNAQDIKDLDMAVRFGAFSAEDRALFSLVKKNWVKSQASNRSEARNDLGVRNRFVEGYSLAQIVLSVLAHTHSFRELYSLWWAFHQDHWRLNPAERSKVLELVREIPKAAGKHSWVVFKDLWELLGSEGFHQLATPAERMRVLEIVQKMLKDDMSPKTWLEGKEISKFTDLADWVVFKDLRELIGSEGFYRLSNPAERMRVLEVAQKMPRDVMALYPLQIWLEGKEISRFANLAERMQVLDKIGEITVEIAKHTREKNRAMTFDRLGSLFYGGIQENKLSLISDPAERMRVLEIAREIPSYAKEASSVAFGTFGSFLCMLGDSYKAMDVKERARLMEQFVSMIREISYYAEENIGLSALIALSNLFSGETLGLAEDLVERMRLLEKFMEISREFSQYGEADSKKSFDDLGVLLGGKSLGRIKDPQEWKLILEIRRLAPFDAIEKPAAMNRLKDALSSIVNGSKTLEIKEILREFGTSATLAGTDGEGSDAASRAYYRILQLGAQARARQVRGEQEDQSSQTQALRSKSAGDELWTETLGNKKRSETRGNRDIAEVAFEKVRTSVVSGWAGLGERSTSAKDPLIASALGALLEYRLANALEVLARGRMQLTSNAEIVDKLVADFPLSQYSEANGWNTSHVDLEEQTALFRGIEHALTQLSHWSSLTYPLDQETTAEIPIPLFWAGDPHYAHKEKLFLKGIGSLEKMLELLFPGRTVGAQPEWSQKFADLLPVIVNGNRVDDLSRAPEVQSLGHDYLIDHRDAFRRLMDSGDKEHIAIFLDNVGGETFGLILAAWIMIRMGKTVTIYGKQEPMLVSDTTLPDLQYSVLVFDLVMRAWFGDRFGLGLRDSLRDGKLQLRASPRDYLYHGEKVDGRKSIGTDFDPLGGYDVAVIEGEFQYGDFMREQLRKVYGSIPEAPKQDPVVLNPFPKTALVFLKANKNSRELTVAVEAGGYKSGDPTRGEFVVQVLPPATSVLRRSEDRSMERDSFDGKSIKEINRQLGLARAALEGEQKDARGSGLERVVKFTQIGLNEIDAASKAIALYGAGKSLIDEKTAALIKTYVVFNAESEILDLEEVPGFRRILEGGRIDTGLHAGEQLAPNTYRANHMRRAITFFRALTSGYFDYYLRRLPAGESPEEFERILRIFKSQYDRLSPEEKRMIWAEIKLHDIGFSESSDSVGHEARGARLAREILTKDGRFTAAQIDTICSVMERHTFVGWTYLGERRMRKFMEEANESQIRFLLLHNQADGPASGVGEMRMPARQVATIASWFDPVERQKVAEHFDEFRITKTARPSMIAPDPGLAELLQLEQAMREIVGPWREVLKVQMRDRLDVTDGIINVFYRLVSLDPSFHEFVKFWKFLGYLGAMVGGQDVKIYGDITNLIPGILRDDGIAQRTEVVAQAVLRMPPDLMLEDVRRALDGLLEGQALEFFGMPLRRSGNEILIETERVVNPSVRAEARNGGKPQATALIRSEELDALSDDFHKQVLARLAIAALLRSNSWPAARVAAGFIPKGWNRISTAATGYSHEGATNGNDLIVDSDVNTPGLHEHAEMNLILRVLSKEKDGIKNKRDRKRYGELLEEIRNLIVTEKLNGSFLLKADDLEDNLSASSFVEKGLPEGWDRGKLKTIMSKILKKTVTKKEWAEALNSILKHRMRISDYQLAYRTPFVRKHLDKEVIGFLKRAQDPGENAGLADVELERLNRALLEAFYPKQIRNAQMNAYNRGLALLEEALNLAGNPFKDGTLYVTLMPCKNCQPVLKKLQLKTIFYDETHRDVNKAQDWMKQVKKMFPEGGATEVRQIVVTKPDKSPNKDYYEVLHYSPWSGDGHERFQGYVISEYGKSKRDAEDGSFLERVYSTIDRNQKRMHQIYSFLGEVPPDDVRLFLDLLIKNEIDPAKLGVLQRKLASDSLKTEEDQAFLLAVFDGVNDPEIKAMLRQVLERSETESDFEGTFRARPKRAYGYFQLGLIDRAFTRYVERLNAKFPELNDKFARPTLKIKNRMAYTDLEEESRGLHHLLRKLSVEDFKLLLRERVERFERIEKFFDSLEALSEANIDEAVDNLVEAWGWIHVGRPSHNVFRLVSQKQEEDARKTLSLEERPLMELAALKGESREGLIWTRRLKHHEKIKGVAAIVESIRNDEGAYQFFQSVHSFSDIEMQELRSKYRDVYNQMEEFSKNWQLSDEDVKKLGYESPDESPFRGTVRNEDISKGIETLPFAEYFHQIILKQLPAEKIISTEQLLRLLDPYDLKYPGLLHELRAHHEELYHALQLYARDISGQPTGPLADETTALALGKLKGAQKKEASEIAAQRADKSFRKIKDVLSLGAQEFSFMEDTHQLITRFQKKLYPLLTRKAEKHRNIFVNKKGAFDPALIFDLNAEEIQALFKDKVPGYLKLTFARQKLCERGEIKLEGNWKAHPEHAVRFVRDYAKEMIAVKDVLLTQERMAHYDGVKQYYRDEAGRINDRIAHLYKIAEKAASQTARSEMRDFDKTSDHFRLDGTSFKSEQAFAELPNPLGRIAIPTFALSSLLFLNGCVKLHAQVLVGNPSERIVVAIFCLVAAMGMLGACVVACNVYIEYCTLLHKLCNLNDVNMMQAVNRGNFEKLVKLNDKRAIKFLIEGIAGIRSTDDFEKTIITLKRLGVTNEQIRLSLVDWLGKNGYFSNFWAINELHDLNPSQAIPFLIGFMKHAVSEKDDGNEWRQVLKMLKEFGAAKELVFVALVDLLDQGMNSLPRVVEGLRELNDPRGIEHLEKRLMRSGSREEFSLIVDAMNALGAPEEKIFLARIKWLFEANSYKEIKVDGKRVSFDKKLMVENIGILGDSKDQRAIPILVAISVGELNADEKIRRTAMAALFKMGANDIVSIKLEQILDDEKQEKRIHLEAFSMWLMFESSRMVKMLEKILANDKRQYLHIGALRQLANLGNDQAKAELIIIDKLLSRLQEQNMSIEYATLKSIPVVRKALGNLKELSMVVDLGMRLVQAGIPCCDAVEVGVPLIYAAGISEGTFILNLKMLGEGERLWAQRAKSVHWVSLTEEHKIHRRFIREVLTPIIRMGKDAPQTMAIVDSFLRKVNVKDTTETQVTEEADFVCYGSFNVYLDTTHPVNHVLNVGETLDLTEVVNEVKLYAQTMLPRAEIRDLKPAGVSMAPLTSQTRAERADQMTRSILKSTQPATVFVDAEDFVGFSGAQKQEYLFVALSNKALRVVVYNERDQKDKGLEALLKLDRVTRTGMDLARAAMRFDRPNTPSIHLSKQILPTRELVQRLGKRVSFFKTQGQNGGTLAAALLWAWSGGETAGMAGVKKEDGFWIVAEALVNALQRSYDTSLAFAVAA